MWVLNPFVVVGVPREAAAVRVLGAVDVARVIGAEIVAELMDQRRVGYFRRQVEIGTDATDPAFARHAERGAVWRDDDVEIVVLAVVAQRKRGVGGEDLRVLGFSNNPNPRRRRDPSLRRNADSGRPAPIGPNHRSRR